MKKILIIGSWPAWMMTAASLLENAKTEDFEIHIFEANASLGRKLLISGGGRCNVTTGIFDKKILKTKYIRGFDFFENFLWEFSPKKCKKWFENHGLKLKTEDDLRIFPVSDDAHDVLGIFEKIFEENKNRVKIHFKNKILKVEKSEKNFKIFTENAEFEAGYLVIATGGNAYAHTGSKGDGYHFAKNFGHSITNLWPSLSSFLIEEEFFKKISGISFENAKIIFGNNFEKNISWSLLCTHFGISGPLTFMLSSHLAWEKIEKNIIKFVPIADYNAEKWNIFLRENFEKFPKRKIFAIISEILPKKFSEIFIENFCKNISEKMVGEISKKDREYIAKLLGNGIDITLLERRPWDEFVTAGGVETSEINEKTLESKITENLFFAGEILNIDGYTGGFSLQICWSTGYRAWKTLAEKLEKNS